MVKNVQDIIVHADVRQTMNGLVKDVNFKMPAHKEAKSDIYFIVTKLVQKT